MRYPILFAHFHSRKIDRCTFPRSLHPPPAALTSKALHPCVTFAASKVTKTARGPSRKVAQPRTPFDLSFVTACSQQLLVKSHTKARSFCQTSRRGDRGNMRDFTTAFPRRFWVLLPPKVPRAGRRTRKPVAGSCLWRNRIHLPIE